MAPAITSALTISNEHLPLNNKMRKPMVEKMRRDRINSSIEQLKSLLAPEFLNQQPDSKLEKADILETTPPSDENRRESVLPQLSSTEQQIISREKFSKERHLEALYRGLSVGNSDML
ncbi:transcription factor HES-5-like [Clarias magur]|uniref:Transcription factor HES-5-like n=1 Tax=Clarias magur TaxID=1594786 RepID=A0A8J4XDQ0_CLAMG|nr:transcription factor HES-5-like [Clarias magur]